MDVLLISSVTALALLYVPGFLLLKAFRFQNIVALAAAPIMSAAAYGVLPIIYAKAGISCNVFNVALAPTAVFAIASALSIFVLGGNSTSNADGSSNQESSKPISTNPDKLNDWLVFSLYILCGIVVCSITFIANLGSPEAFFSRYDNQTHLNMTQSFVDSGLWSAIDHSRYAAFDANQSPYEHYSSGFYPNTWHIIVALTCLITSAKVTVASNALVAVVAAFVFPAGMFLLIRALFPYERSVIIAGAFATVSFATYPWVFPIKGPTFPNMLGFALMVPAMAVIIDYLELETVRRHIVQFCVFSAISFVSLALAHTSSLFTAFVFLAPYGGHYINKHMRTSQRIPASKRNLARIGALVAYIALIVAFWAFCLTTPILSGVIGYSHVEDNSIVSAVGGLVALRLTINTAQYVMMLVSFVGVIACIRRRMWWILIPVIYMAIGYVVSRIGLEPLLTIFMGLWYSLPYRAGACLCIFLMPIAALGLSEIWKFVTNFANSHGSKKTSLGSGSQVAGIVVCILFALATFAPVCIPIAGHDLQTPFNSIYKQLSTTVYGQDGERVYGAEEVAFVDKVVETIPEDALVINSPHDGSMFAYGVNCLNVYYKANSLKHQKDESITIRKKLNEYATNPDVQKAIKYTGAQYVLKLDQGVSYEDLIKLPQYYENKRTKWSGIDSVDDSTPGFTIVLSEGDMRLYHIDDIANL